MVREAAAKASAEDVGASARHPRASSATCSATPRPSSHATWSSTRSIAVISGNPIYVAVSEAMLGWLKEYHTEMLIWTGKEKFTLAEHEEIIERIEAHDAEGAEQAMIKHLERSRALYMLHASGNS